LQGTGRAAREAAREGEKLRRQGVLVVLALAATMVVGVSSASAARRYATHIVFLGNSGPSLQDQTLYGDLNTNPKCRGARQLGLFKKTSSGFRLLDVDLSSFNGAWALRADLTGTPDLAVQVTREKRSRGRVVCKRAALKLTAKSAAPEYSRAR
jgi:hypothetical protein